MAVPQLEFEEKVDKQFKAMRTLPPPHYRPDKPVESEK
jgi:hypothetical protein